MTKLNRFLISVFLIGISCSAYSQFTVFDSYDFRAMVCADGDLFRYAPLDSSLFEIPKNSGKSTIYTATLMFGGINQDGDTCFSGHLYRSQNGADFWSGPITNSYDSDYDMVFQRFWHLTAEEINVHRHQFGQAQYTMPSTIYYWPWAGNISKGESSLLAPFYDANKNGKYEPNLGDYPIIRGEEAIYYMFNDDRNIHTETKGFKMGIEVHAMAYVMGTMNAGYDSAMSKILFINYNLFNRRNQDFSKFYLGKFVDFDLGYPMDDFVGCDTVRNMFYCYNANNNDPGPNGYGYVPPVQSCVFLNQNLAAFNVPTQIQYSNPLLYKMLYRSLTGLTIDGSLIINPLTQNSTPYFASGDPYLNQDWWEGGAGHIPYDRRGIGSVGPFEFKKGTSLSTDVAFIYSRSPIDTALYNNITSVYEAQINADYVTSLHNALYSRPLMTNTNFSANIVTSSNFIKTSGYAYCETLNYQNPIDSVRLLSVSSIGVNQTMTNWKVYQNGQLHQVSNVKFEVQDNTPVLLYLNLIKNPDTTSMESYTIRYFVDGLVGVNEFEKRNNIVIKPNPAKNHIQISGMEQVSEIFINDFYGREVKQYDNNSSNESITLNIADLKNGLYLVQFFDKSHRLKSVKKIVVQ